MVRWAAILHDCRRQDDGADPAHGRRAAQWFGAHAATIAPDLSRAQVAAVQHCMTWHVPPDTACPQMTPELQALKDGDGLDRVRLGDFAPRYLRTPYLHDQVETARALWRASQPRPGRAPWGLVREAALARGLWA